MTVTDAELNWSGIKCGSNVKATINGFPILSGYVEKISPSVSASDHSVSIEGRDITADLIDSTLNAGSVELVPPVTLEQIIARVQTAVGTEIKVINEVPGLKPYGLDELVSYKAGDAAFSFLEKFARKRQVLLNTDGKGAIVISRNSKESAPFSIVNRRVDNGANNVLSSSASYDFSERFRDYVVVSQANLVGSSNFGEPDLDAVVSVKSGVVTDTEVRKGRVLNIVAEKNSSIAEALERAKWEANIRKARSLKYSVTLDGITIPGTPNPYQINRLVEVIDEVANISSVMLIKSASFSVSASSSETSLELTSPDAYTLELEEPEKKSQAKKKGSSVAPEFI